MPEPQITVGLAKEVAEYIVHAFGTGKLTTSGTQYNSTGATSSESELSSSTDITAFTEIDNVTITPVSGPDAKDYAYNASILEVEFSLTAALRCTTSSDAVCTYKWQARDYTLGTTSTTDYVDLTSWNTTAPGTTFLDVTNSGYFNVQTNFSKIPFQIRLLLYNGTASSCQAQGKTKNSSYVRVVYRVA